MSSFTGIAINVLRLAESVIGRRPSGIIGNSVTPEQL
jgi:hypothetical protein